jgi:hypothetical protein
MGTGETPLTNTGAGQLLSLCYLLFYLNLFARGKEKEEKKRKETTTLFEITVVENYVEMVYQLEGKKVVMNYRSAQAKGTILLYRYYADRRNPIRLHGD